MSVESSQDVLKMVMPNPAAVVPELRGSKPAEEADSGGNFHLSGSSEFDLIFQNNRVEGVRGSFPGRNQREWQLEREPLRVCPERSICAAIGSFAF